MARSVIAPIGSRWSANRTPDRVFIVVERLPFGRLLTKEQGRAYVGEVQQRQLIADFTRLPDL